MKVLRNEGTGQTQFPIQYLEEVYIIKRLPKTFQKLLQNLKFYFSFLIKIMINFLFLLIINQIFTKQLQSQDMKIKHILKPLSNNILTSMIQMIMYRNQANHHHSKKIYIQSNHLYFFHLHKKVLCQFLNVLSNPILILLMEHLN